MPDFDVREQRLTSRILAVVCLLFFFYLAVNAALAKAPTTDEPLHLVRGVALSQSGDLNTPFEHPPLSHRLISSLLFTEPQVLQVRFRNI